MKKVSSDSLHYKRRFLGGILEKMWVAKGVDEAPTSMWHLNDRLEKVDKSPTGPPNDDPTHHQAHVADHGQINLVKAYGDPAHQVCAKIIKPGSHFHTPDNSAFYKCISSTSTKGDTFSSNISSSAHSDNDEQKERNPPSLALQEDKLVEVSKIFGFEIYIDKTKIAVFFQKLSLTVPHIFSKDELCRFRIF
eukprot:TRINITY_DN2426_c0_g1_i16.p1 TRINITY_DN2426_c0_g1~~TRINITY_DN2426_c0_g1_i16.p1  ORF type:complete len:192 (-),score=37.69 TRINITY_DN2426_c0_g1_i16:606-1181(-)